MKCEEKIVENISIKTRGSDSEAQEIRKKLKYDKVNVYKRLSSANILRPRPSESSKEVKQTPEKKAPISALCCWDLDYCYDICGVGVRVPVIVSPVT